MNSPAAVPGLLAGMFHVHKKLGSMPMKELVQPAIEKAKNGFVISKQLESLLDLVNEVILSTPDSRSIFTKNGKLMREGDVMKVSKYADFLDFIGREGVNEFYKGEIAQKIAKDCKEKGGLISLKDLSDYRVYEREPLRFKYNGYDVCTNPPPSSGGTLIAFILNMFEKHGIKNMKFGDFRHISLLANAMRLTDTERVTGFDGKVNFLGIEDDFLINHIKKYDPQFRHHALKIGTTTHITVVDKKKNIASTTTSHGEGSGYIIPGTDIMLNNMLGEVDLNAGGFHEWTENKRVTSMMAPTIASLDGKPVIATGTGGANRIRTAIAQVLINSLYFKLPIYESVNNPRFHWNNRILDIEPGFKQSEIERIEVPETDKYVVWNEKAMYFGGNHSVAINRDGSIEGSGDNRRSGTVLEC